MTFDDLLALREDFDFEAKAAQGKSGQGSVPRDVWESYSAMANTEGGVIVLGAEEKSDGSLNILGIREPRKLKSDLWNTLNNSQKASVNLLSERDIEIATDGDTSLIVIHVPQAPRKQRPVYINGNPITGSFRRKFEGDYVCPESVVRRMLAEADEDTRDARILVGFV